MSDANKTQVGGSHYKTDGEEHWDRVNRLGLDYFQGQITKYVERCWKKNGVEDLKKARHFLDKYIELHTHSQTADCCLSPQQVVEEPKNRGTIQAAIQEGWGVISKPLPSWGCVTGRYGDGQAVIQCYSCGYQSRRYHPPPACPQCGATRAPELR